MPAPSLNSSGHRVKCMEAAWRQVETTVHSSNLLELMATPPYQVGVIPPSLNTLNPPLLPQPLSLLTPSPPLPTALTTFFPTLEPTGTFSSSRGLDYSRYMNPHSAL